MRTFGLLAIAFLLSFTPAALADSINMVVTGTIASHAGEGSNGFYMATYPNSSQFQFFDAPQVGETDVAVSFPNFTLLYGTYVTSATLTVSFAPVLGYTYTPGAGGGSGPVDTSNPYVPGQIQATVTGQGSVPGFALGSCEISAPGNTIDLLQDGFGRCLTGFVDSSVFLSYETIITPTLVSPGYNSWEVFDYTGSTSTDFTADLDIDYQYTPEPSSFLLLGSGLAGLAVMIRRKFNL